MRHLPLLRGAAVLGCAAALAACSPTDSHNVLGPAAPSGGALFRSYVSLGNSITAGYQSGGINDSTQRAAYPVLLARAMGTSFVYPSLTMPGCPPPIANFQTQARVGPAVPNNCALRNPALVSDRVNNVAVPGATSFDPTNLSTSASNALTTLVLGGETQVQRALQAKPTFATVWIGNNDVLGPALVGLLSPTPPYSPGVTPTATFTANYAAMMNALKAGAPDLNGVLIGIANVAYLPTFTRGYIIAGSPQLQFAINQAAGTTVTVLPDCANSTSLVDLIQMIPQIRAYVASSGTAGYPPYIACAKGDFPPSPLVGEVVRLDDRPVRGPCSEHLAFLHGFGGGVR